MTYSTAATSLVFLRVRHVGFSEKTTYGFRESFIRSARNHDSILLRYANFFDLGVQMTSVVEWSNAVLDPGSLLLTSKNNFFLFS